MSPRERVRLAALVEGVRVPSEQEIGPVRVVPMPNVLLGRALGPMLAEAFEGLGSSAELDTPGFRTQISAPRPVAALLIQGEGEDWLHLDRTMRAYVDAARDVLTLTYGGSTRLLADVLELEREEGWQSIGMTAGGPEWPRSAFQELAPDGYSPPIPSTKAMLDAIAESQLIAFWVRLFTTALTEPAWDVRIFRLWSVLETIAKNVVPAGIPIAMPDGGPILKNGVQETTAAKLPRVYELLRRAHAAMDVPGAIAVCHPDHDLWDEVRVWYSIRNGVAHDGSWDVSAQGGANVEEFVVRAARPTGTLEEGCDRYRKHLEANTEAVVLAAIAGSLTGTG